jgi:hypothetical protein
VRELAAPSESKCGSSRRFLGCDSPGIEQRHRYDDSEDEAADVREERHAASVRRCRREAGVRFDELVDEPAAEVDPGRDLDDEDEQQRADVRAWIENDEGRTAAIAPLAPSVGTRAAAAVPKSSVTAVCAIVAAKPPAM